MVDFIYYSKENPLGSKKKQVVDFVVECDQSFVPPLASRGIDLYEYVEKLERKGVILVVWSEEQKILGVGMFYCNDHETQRAFGTWWSTSPEGRAENIGFLMILETMEYCKKHGMKYFETQTWSTNRQILAIYQKGLGAEIIEEKEEIGRTTLRLRVNLLQDKSDSE